MTDAEYRCPRCGAVADATCINGCEAKAQPVKSADTPETAARLRAERDRRIQTRLTLDPWPDFDDLLTRALAALDARERELTQFHAAIDELSIGDGAASVVLHCVVARFPPFADPNAHVPAPKTYALRPDQVEGVFAAIRAHAETLGDFGRMAVQSHYEIDSLRARLAEARGEVGKVSRAAERLREQLFESQAAVERLRADAERYREWANHFAQLAVDGDGDTIEGWEEVYYRWEAGLPLDDRPRRAR